MFYQTGPRVKTIAISFLCFSTTIGSNCDGFLKQGNSYCLFLQQCVFEKSFQSSVTVVVILNYHHFDSIFSSIIITVIVYSYARNCGYYFWSSATHIVFFAAMCVWKKVSKQCDCDCLFESSSSVWMYFLKHNHHRDCIFLSTQLWLLFLKQCNSYCLFCSNVCVKNFLKTVWLWLPFWSISITFIAFS